MLLTAISTMALVQNIYIDHHICIIFLEVSYQPPYHALKHCNVLVDFSGNLNTDIGPQQWQKLVCSQSGLFFRDLSKIQKQVHLNSKVMQSMKS